MIKAAFHVASTGRCGPVLVDIPRDIQEAEIDFEYPDEVDLPGWRPPRRVPPAPDRARPRSAIAEAERPILYVGGGVAERATPARSCASWPRSAGCPVVTTLMAKGGFPETHALHFGWPGMHGAEVVELGAEQGRRGRRRGRALRRPRHRQALRVRARRDGRPPRHRRRRDREAPPRGRARRRAAQAGARRARERARRAAARRRDRRRGSRRSRTGASSSRSATATAATCSSRRRSSRRCRR